jgi:hypothetical protein
VSARIRFVHGRQDAEALFACMQPASLRRRRL